MQAFITIKYHSRFDPMILIESLLSYNWSLDDFGNISFMVNDDFDWERADHAIKDVVFKMINERIINNRICGITMINNVIEAGGNFCFDISNHIIVFSFSMNRKSIQGLSLTDFSILIPQLLPIFSTPILSITYEDVFE